METHLQRVENGALPRKKKPRPRWGVPGLGFGVMAIVGHQSQIREAEHSKLRSHRCGLSVTSKRKGADRSGHKKEAPRRSPPGLLSMNWCASAYAGWGRMRFNQTLNVRVGFPKAAVTLVQDKMFLLLRHNFRQCACRAGTKTHRPRPVPSRLNRAARLGFRHS